MEYLMTEVIRPSTLEAMFECVEDRPKSRKATRRMERKAESETRQFRRMPKPLVSRGPAQTAYINSLMENELTIAMGPAGVGKTYVPARLFGQMLANDSIEKLYVARPNISKPKHRMGFLPGGMEEKIAPWMVPIYDGVRDSMAPALFDMLKRDGRIEEVPYEFIQGRTLRNAACIVDEAENLDLDDLYITLTRQGEKLSMVLCGDINQSRIPDSGLAEVAQMVKHNHMESVGLVEFTEDDVVRSRQTMQWVRAFAARKSQPSDNTDSFRSDPPMFLRGR